jgi:hypothetical protein
MDAHELKAIRRNGRHFATMLRHEGNEFPRDLVMSMKSESLTEILALLLAMGDVPDGYKKLATFLRSVNKPHFVIGSAYYFLLRKAAKDEEGA